MVIAFTYNCFFNTVYMQYESKYRSATTNPQKKSANFDYIVLLQLFLTYLSQETFLLEVSPYYIKYEKSGNEKEPIYL